MADLLGSDNNFFNSFSNNNDISASDLGARLDSQTRHKLRQKYEDILGSVDINSSGFIPLERDVPYRPRILQLPDSVDHHFPYTFFNLFFTDFIFQTICDNINAYAL